MNIEDCPHPDCVNAVNPPYPFICDHDEPKWGAPSETVYELGGDCLHPDCVNATQPRLLTCDHYGEDLLRPWNRDQLLQLLRTTNPKMQPHGNAVQPV